MECQRCGGNRIASIEGQSSDGNYGDIEGKKFCGEYVPSNIGIGGGDYIRFSWCLNCGQIQGEWPVYHQDDENEE